MFDIWNEEDPLVRQQYEKNNYLIVDNDEPGAKPYCVIYFSSNGLYFPNTEETFVRFAKDDRFEWRKHHFANVRREIYVRDIFKQWYVRGINSRINTMDELISWLAQNIPKGCDTITVGNSAGGYMAVLAACKLNARYAYDFSGQFSIEDALGGDESKNALLKKYIARENGLNKYLDISEYVKNAPDLDVFYFYPAKCDDDIKQAALVKDCGNVYAFRFESKVHGETMYNFNLDDVFAINPEQLTGLSDRLAGKVISRIGFSIYVRGISKTAWQLALKAIKKKR